jgi:predicted CoA-binding protein
MNDENVRELLQQTRSIAVVGISSDPSKPSHYVAAYMQARGYRVIPVNPRYPEVLGERCYPNLQAIPGKVDMVDVFRRAEDCPAIAEQAAAIGAKSLWLQLGIVSTEAEAIARQGGLQVVMDACLMVEHRRLLPG